MTRYPKRPRAPRRALTVADRDVLAYTGVLWRVHRTLGRHALGWDVLRAFGPVATCRWEPHTPPAREQPERAVMYTATDLATAVLETFQATRRIDPHAGAPRATSWAPARPLHLLDLPGDWPLRNGASAALTSGPHASCRAWARAIREQLPTLDGLWTTSTLTGRANVTLWSPAADTFPDRPGFSEPLADDLLWDALDRIAHRYRHAGYRLI